MGPAMRRAKQQLSNTEASAILLKGEYGVLGTVGTEGYPYAVPLSYAYAADGPGPLGSLYAHCAPVGRKLDALAADERVCFTVVGESSVAPEKLTALYRSVMAFGRARLAEDVQEKRTGLLALGAKYCPGLEAMVDDEIEKLIDRTAVLVIDVEEFTGKEAIELTRQR